MDLIYVIPAIILIIISILIVKIASVALNLTGLDSKRAFFQALSAFTGTGFTTADSELIVNNDTRRKIVMILMILGNAGLISVITTLVLSFRGAGLTPTLINITIILLALLVIIMIFTNRSVARKLTKKIQERLVKTKTFTKRPVTEILRLAAGYGIAEFILNEHCVDVGKTLSKSSFREKDILILAIERGRKIIPTPHAAEELQLNDTIICYGKLDNIAKVGKKAMEPQG
ncbi:MAG: TrkA C-terminal domain-containing protein [Candidatus Omnitrophota bacterium]|jgi:K+/H+ antiporter YhaU regulatory subunit KhtT